MNYKNIEGTSFGCWEFLDKNRYTTVGTKKEKAFLILCRNCLNKSIMVAYNIRRRRHEPTRCEHCKSGPKGTYRTSNKYIMGFKIEIVEAVNERNKLKQSERSQSREENKVQGLQPKN